MRSQGLIALQMNKKKNFCSKMFTNVVVKVKAIIINKYSECCSWTISAIPLIGNHVLDLCSIHYPWCCFCFLYNASRSIYSNI